VYTSNVSAQSLVVPQSEREAQTLVQKGFPQQTKLEENCSSLGRTTSHPNEHTSTLPMPTAPTPSTFPSVRLARKRLVGCQLCAVESPQLLKLRYSTVHHSNLASDSREVVFSRFLGVERRIVGAVVKVGIQRANTEYDVAWGYSRSVPTLWRLWSQCRYLVAIVPSVTPCVCVCERRLRCYLVS
jgi:hypothetical protein